MEVTLFAILCHQSFDWSCRTSKVALVSNMEEIVKDIGKLKKVETVPSSPLGKAAKRLYELVKKPKSANLGKEMFVKVEEDTLKKYKVKVEEKQVDQIEGKDEDEEVYRGVTKCDEEKELKQPKKRKSFSELKDTRSKKARLGNVLKIVEGDDGLGQEVFKHFKREESEKTDGGGEDFKLCCLNLMKTLRLSDTKYDDLRWWIMDILERGFSLSAMPASNTLKAKVLKEMVPPNMCSSATGAEFQLNDVLFHTGRRFLERPDIKEQVKEGDTVIHLAKVGADFCSGFGKLQQKKECEYDEDGSHNTGVQTLKLSLPGKTIFSNEAPGGSELLRLISKSTHKDTEARMIEQMEFLDNAAKEIPEQEIDVEGVGKVQVQHHLVNCLHDGKERRVMVQHKVRSFNNL